LNKAKKLLIPGAIMGAALLGMGASTLLTSLQANAATTNGSATTAGTAGISAGTGDTEISATAAGMTQNPDQPDPSQGGHVGANGTREELLTGDTAAKVKAAALAAYPGGTIQRVETDAEGSPYEAHMTKADGTRITVKVDSSFNVTSTETGHRGRR
jgi:hypothetical protein